MTASCETFARWLDAGRPAAGEPAARGHAEGCARCAASLRAALEVEGLLAAGLAPAPAGFAARVMERVEAARRAGGALAPSGYPPHAGAVGPQVFDWWVRAAADPAAALALGLAALVAWRGVAMVAFAARGLEWLSAQPLFATAAAAGGTLARAAGSLSLTAPGPIGLVVLMALPWASWLLFRWSESLVQPRRVHVP